MSDTSIMELLELESDIDPVEAADMAIEGYAYQLARGVEISEEEMNLLNTLTNLRKFVKEEMDY